MKLTCLVAVAAVCSVLAERSVEAQCIATFSRAATVSSGYTKKGYVGKVKVRDLDGDGVADIVMAIHGSGSDAGAISIAFGAGAQTFVSAMVFPLDVFGANDVAIADFDNDGRMDVAATHSTNKLTVLLQKQKRVSSRTASRGSIAAAAGVMSW